MVGHFLGGIAALIWDKVDDTFLLLKRSSTRDVGAGHWESVTGRVDQGEGFEEALHREVKEEVGLDVQIEYIIGTTHFYRGEAIPENELLGVIYCCTPKTLQEIQLTHEHDEMRWVTIDEARRILNPERWLLRSIEYAHTLSGLLTEEQRTFFRECGFTI